ncbi:MAG: DUF2892 domain-containing protein [Phycisphaerales bacterium]
MKRNANGIDRLFRFTLGIAVLGGAFVWLGASQGEITGVIAAVIGAILILTGLAGYCPAYRVIGRDTCRTRAT